MPEFPFEFDDVLPTIQRSDTRANRDDAEEALSTAVAEGLEKGWALTAANVVRCARFRLSDALRRRERKNLSLEAFAEDTDDHVPVELAVEEVDFESHVRLSEAKRNPVLRLRLLAGGVLRRRGPFTTASGRTFADEEVAEARRLRTEEKLSYAKIAQRFGASETTVAKWCRGERRTTGTVSGWSRSLIEEAIRAVAAEDGVQPTATMMKTNDHRLPALNTFYQHFDSIEEAIRSAGLPYKPLRRGQWDFEEARASILSLVAELGRWPTWEEWKAEQRKNGPHRVPCSRSLKRLFGAESMSGVRRVIGDT